MPVSAEMNQKKNKTKSEILCDQMDGMISHAQKQLNVFEKIKQDLEYEPGLLQKAASMKLASEDDIKQVASEMKEWKTEVKNEVKAAVLSKRNELKLERKTRRKNLQEPDPEKRSRTRTKKKRGGFI